ncbi:hypothetical protein K1T71_013268 [Dendrolimus kikuchii]|uniref:Uncharacterized protein n=1 Tax=Dendrolimus kikuchii TaxID=765133 RepID=A0ACC1CI03_9NEOP|nr:hypothetical protein K1T71_013268 [Dendrolimus kikuchii]
MKFNKNIVHGILGGHDTNIEIAPYQVNYGDICGAVLIHCRWALTTAHCGTKENYIRVGSKRRLEGPKVKILSHIIHPQYGLQHEFDYDVQLLRFYRSLHFSKLVSAIRLCEGNCGRYVFVSGWGYSEEKGEYNEVLQQIHIKIVPMTICQSYKQSWYNNTLTPRMFCAGGREQDACQGDSGGGAVTSGRLVGLSSFGFGCGRNYPGVYTNISEREIFKWIHYYTGLD